MNWLRLRDVKGRISRVTGLCSTDQRLLDLINAAQERLMEAGNWAGAVARYKVCVTSGCVTLPREIEKIEAAAIARKPARMRGAWYEFIEHGPGVVTSADDIGIQMIDRGYACAFDDVLGTNKKLAVWNERAEASGAVVNLQFYDHAGQWVRTSYQGEFIDGENVLIGAKGTYSYTTRMASAFGLAKVVKPVTNGVIRLYEYSVDNDTYKPLGQYAPDEEVPTYKRYFIPSLERLSGEDCDSVAIEMLAKLRAIPAVSDDDFLFIHSAEALRLMAQAIRKEEQNLFADALAYEEKAKLLLNNQLANSRSSSEEQPVNRLGGGVTGPAVLNLI
jgi:hypothetical protein